MGGAGLTCASVHRHVHIAALATTTPGVLLTRRSPKNAWSQGRDTATPAHSPSLSRRPGSLGLHPRLLPASWTDKVRNPQV